MRMMKLFSAGDTVKSIIEVTTTLQFIPKDSVGVVYTQPTDGKGVWTVFNTKHVYLDLEAQQCFELVSENESI